MTKVIALDAGHGLYTPGKQTPDRIKEWTLNDKVRDKIVEMLSDYDVKFIFPDNNEGTADESLTSRRTMYVNKKVDAAVSIHHNAYTGEWGKATGVEVFTDRKATAADKELASLIYENLPEYIGLKGRGIKQANWSVIYQNKVPAVLVEGGFMDSTIDHPVITSEKGQNGYARAVAEGLIAFLDLKKKVDTNTPFKVKLKMNMNVRDGAGTKNKKVDVAKKNYVYTITETVMVGKTPWGRLKSGVGWVSIADKYCDRV